MIDQAYIDTVRLLLRVVPDVFRGDVFAMKGGTAINLFVQDMPRLSVDIDVTFVSHELSREDALRTIAAELALIQARLEQMGLSVHMGKQSVDGETRLLVEDDRSQVKIEANEVFRGTVFPVERRKLAASTAQMFSVAVEAPVLAEAELYGGKIVAALDRQHPRDLFDVLKLYERSGLTQEILESVVIYLGGHNRPIHEVLFGTDKDIRATYLSGFVGMTLAESPSLDSLLEVRSRLRADLAERLTEKQRRFLIGLAGAQPDWTLLDCRHAGNLPALRWKLLNLEKFRKSRPTEFARHVEILAKRLGA